jgi:hypothetical protein
MMFFLYSCDCCRARNRAATGQLPHYIENMYLLVQCIHMCTHNRCCGAGTWTGAARSRFFWLCRGSAGSGTYIHVLQLCEKKSSALNSTSSHWGPETEPQGAASFYMLEPEPESHQNHKKSIKEFNELAGWSIYWFIKSIFYTVVAI